jgi:hypothetical protein
MGSSVVYNRHDYLKEKCDALERWADFVQGQATDPGEKIIP